MIVREQVSLAELTSFRTGGRARFVLEATSQDELQEAYSFIKKNNLNHYILGEGTNTLALDTDYDGAILAPRLTELSWSDGEVAVGAGVSWDRLVATCADQGLWGLENLAGIPGTVGASPVQNIGAYGVEVRDLISFVEVMTTKGVVRRFTNEECGFAYRDSVFKREAPGIIMRVGFKLTKDGAPHLSYPDLARACDEGVSLSTPEEIGDAVRVIRAKKFPDLKTHGTAGSFFKNPVISQEVYEELRAKYLELPGYVTSEGVKISLAFVLDKVLNLRGFRMGHAWLYDKQPLVLVLDEGGRAEEVEQLAHEVSARVFDATTIKIEREVRTLQ